MLGIWIKMGTWINHKNKEQGMRLYVIGLREKDPAEHPLGVQDLVYHTKFLQLMVILVWEMLAQIMLFKFAILFLIYHERP